MFYCKICGYNFEQPSAVYENHGFLSPPYEKLYVCPNCKSDCISERFFSHCRCCGARLTTEDSEYCSEACKIRGERLRRLEEKRRRRFSESPLNMLVREVEEYNLKNNTNYSYGQYVAIILPKLKTGKKKCTKKRKHI